MDRMMELHDAKNFEQMAAVVPDELPVQSDQIARYLGAIGERFGLSRSQIVLGGFSQGAMLGCDVALRIQGDLGGLILWSGTLIAEPRWARFANSAEPMAIVQSHGRFDDVLPFFAAEKLQEFLTSEGNDVRFVPFDGFHQTNPEGLQATVDLIRRSLTSAL